MANLALPSTSEYPPDPSELGRQELNGVYLELRHNYERLMRSRGQYRRLSTAQNERISDQNQEHDQQRQQWQAELDRKGEQLRAVLEREARLKAETYALLESVADLMENLEDAGDALTTSFGSFQLSKRRPGPGGSAGGTLAGVGGGMPQLMKGVLHFLNRWREGKQRFRQLISQRESINTLLEQADGRDH